MTQSIENRQEKVIVPKNNKNKTMAAKDYEICVSGLTSTLYLAKVSKRNPNVMLEDRREITESEILMLIDCYTNNKCKDEEYKDGIVCFKSHIQEGKIIEIRLRDKTQGNSVAEQ